MTIRLKPTLVLFAIFALSTSCLSFAQIQPSSVNSVAPLAASAPTVVPALIPYSGVTIDRDGHATSAETGITFLIYKDQNGGEPLFTETQTVIPDSTGHYTVRLGASMNSGIPVDLFSSGEARWLEVQVPGERPQPRALLLSVPYALKAADAATLGGLPASAFARVPSNNSLTTPISTTVIPNATTTVTTSGGIANKLAKFSGTSTIVSSILYDNGTDVAIGTTAPTATLDVVGTGLFTKGVTADIDLLLPQLGTATTTKGYNSAYMQLGASAYNSTTKAVVNPRFQLQAEPVGNDTTTPTATLNLLSSTTSATPTETGLYFNANGTIHFASSQTFPGGTGTGSSFCIAIDNGFGNGGTTFVEPAFAVPAAGKCTSWSGFTKTASTVVLTTSGSGCVSSDGKKLTLSVSSADPDYLGPGTAAWDYIQLTRGSTTGSFTAGSDQGEFDGTAKQLTCTSSLLQLNESND